MLPRVQGPKHRRRPTRINSFSYFLQQQFGEALTRYQQQHARFSGARDAIPDLLVGVWASGRADGWAGGCRGRPGLGTGMCVCGEEGRRRT